MKNLISPLLTVAALIMVGCTDSGSSKPIYADYPIRDVGLTHVTLTDAFWLPKIQTVQSKTIQYAFNKCAEEGRFENFITAGKVLKGDTGTVRGKMPFDDTDVYKTIEGAAYSLISAPNKALDAYLDSIIGIIKQGQEPDGYLTTWRTINPNKPPCTWVKGGPRWSDLASSHELYNAGHMYEAAAAHFHATGKRNFLDIALKNADLIVKVFGAPDNYQVPGHEIIETGLVKLYQITGNDKYLLQSKKFMDLRGDTVHRKQLYGAYNQDHMPVVDQKEVVGHAVRAVYLYAGMTDIAAIMQDRAYHAAVDALWNNMVSKKMYITGGLGARHQGESFGENYELPNLTAYNETCAAIGGVYWDDRMFRLTGDAKYYHVLERQLYNGLISGISLSGTEFFYPNPLAADGKYKFNQGALTRSPWFDCSCCPTNLIRFIPYIPNLIYATEGDSTIYVNLFMSNHADIALGNRTVKLTQETNYPWDGKINIKVEANTPQTFAMKIRIPNWAYNEVAPGDLYHYAYGTPSQGCQMKVNGETLTATNLDKGYRTIVREWKSGDEISLELPMEVRAVAVNPLVKNDSAKVSYERGPLVYCAEEIDNPMLIDELAPKPDKGFTVVAQPQLLDGVNVIKNERATLIPYYAWSNRGIGKMRVFLYAPDYTKKQQ